MVRQYDAYRERQGYAGANPTAATAAAPAAAAGAGRTRCSGRRKFANIKYREGSTESDAKPARQDSTAAVDSDAEDEGAGGGGSNSARWEARGEWHVCKLPAVPCLMLSAGSRLGRQTPPHHHTCSVHIDGLTWLPAEGSAINIMLFEQLVLYCYHHGSCELLLTPMH